MDTTTDNNVQCTWSQTARLMAEVFPDSDFDWDQWVAEERENSV